MGIIVGETGVRRNVPLVNLKKSVRME